MALGSTIQAALARSSGTPRQKALDFLISANWAIGAAAEHRLELSEGAIERGLRERIGTAHEGRSEFQEEIAATGQTLADVKLEAKAAQAMARLREFVGRRVPPATQAQIADYYKHHLQSFRVPDRRLVDLIDEIHGYGHAVALGRQLGPGERFRKRAMRELVTRDTPYEDAHHDWKAAMLHAIFATPPGRVGGPVSFHYRWVLFVVRKLVPGTVKPLDEVSAEISARLSEQRHRHALASFLAAYRREWTAKTSCHTGFVVQMCSEYAKKSTIGRSPTVVVVGGTPITKADVQHWMTALSLSNARKRSLRSDESPLQQTVSFLITSRWMIDEAHRRKLGVTPGEVERALEGQENAYTSRSEFTALLKESGRTIADLRFELEAELAFAALRRMLAPDEGKTTASSQRVRHSFLARWTSRWKAQTDCRTGYVVDSCRQHPGPVAIEYPVSVDL